MAKELEIERKWLLKSFPVGFRISKIINLAQMYLSPTERIRHNVIDNVSTYQHFFKEWKGEGSSVEKLTNISGEEYNEYKKKADRVVFKTRHEVRFRHFPEVVYEIDSIALSSLVKLLVMEVEFPSKEEYDTYVLPEVLQPYVIAEVTNQRVFSNYNLAMSINKEEE